MKRLILIASMLLALSVTAFAQSVSVKEVISSASDPSTCIVGKLYINTTSPGRVWARIGGVCVRVDGVAGATPGGSDTQVQFNDGGAFGGDADFTWNKTNNRLALPVTGIVAFGTGSMLWANAVGPRWYDEGPDSFLTFNMQGLTSSRTVTWPDVNLTIPSSFLTNSAGANVIPKSNGTNLVASRITDNPADTSEAVRIQVTDTAGNGIMFRAPSDGAVSAEVGSRRLLIVDAAFIIDSATGQTNIGDADNEGNGTKLVVDDAAQTISVSRSIVPSTAGGTTVGSAALPFSSAYIGAAATNNIQVTGTATAARVTTLPDADTKVPVAPQLITVSGMTAGRTWTAPDFNFTIAGLGIAQTFSAANTFSANGAANTPAVTVSGSWFGQGIPSDSEPVFLIQVAGTTSNNWSPSGTGLGVNAEAGDNGNLIDLMTGGIRRFSVATSTGEVLLSDGNTSAIVKMLTNGTANLRLADNAGTSFGRLQFGGTTSSFPSLKRSGSGLVARLADDSGDATFTASTITASAGLTISSGGATITGQLNLNNSLSGNADLFAGSSSFIGFGTRSNISSPANGQLRLLNAAGNDFSQLQFGGTSSSFPSLKRSSTSLIVRLADDSADAPLTTSKLTSSASGSAFEMTGTSPLIEATANTGMEIKQTHASGSGITFSTRGTNRWEVAGAGHFMPKADSSFDIGNGVNMDPRNVFAATSIGSRGSIKAATYLTATNCADSAGAAACGSASAGAVVIDAGATTVVVSSTAVTANSRITLTEDSSLGTELGITCNTSLTRTYAISARTAGTSFTINTSAAPVTNAACLTYRIVN